MSTNRSTQSKKTMAELRESYVVIASRLCKSFPELTRCLAWMRGGLEAGATWCSLVDDYVRNLGERKAITLDGEIHDNLHMGLDTEPDLDAVTSVLGWDAKHSTVDVPGSREMLTGLSEVIEGVWEAVRA